MYLTTSRAVQKGTLGIHCGWVTRIVEGPMGDNIRHSDNFIWKLKKDFYVTPVDPMLRRTYGREAMPDETKLWWHT